MPPHERAELHRRRGNELYGKAREFSKDGGNVMNLQAVHQSMGFYKQAMVEYAIAMESTPQDHRLYSNRALCYLAVEDWQKAREDAQYCARLRPDFKKGWLLLTKALYKLGKYEEASDQLQAGLRHLPGCSELLELQADFNKEVTDASFRSASRSVSPACTPPVSRQGTPSRGDRGDVSYRRSGSTPPPPPPPPKRNSGSSQTYAGPSTSPGPSARGPTLDGSTTFPTGNFGAPTPSFAGRTAGAMPSSFPEDASHRSGHSPGPSMPGTQPGTARTGTQPPTARSSHSPGPARARTPPGPDLGASGGRERSSSLRKSTSLKGMLDSSLKRDKTPPSRGATPPRGQTPPRPTGH